MIGRALVLVVCVAAARGLASAVQPGEVALDRTPLMQMPLRIGHWEGIPDPPLTPDVLEVLRVDDYLSRRYVAHEGRLVGLYIGYYESQRQGQTIHSPQHCLPGTGWVPVRTGRREIQTGPGKPIVVNRYLVQKGVDKQLVFYWYQGRGRVVASDYLNKFYLVFDAVRYNRSDGALVRVTAPIGGSEDEAERAAVEFICTVQPLLARYVPG